MHILVVASDFPFPVHGGRNMRTWRFIDALHQRHVVSILCFGSLEDIKGVSEEAKNYFSDIWMVECSRDKGSGTGVEGGLAKRVGNFMRGVPWELANAYSGEFRDKLLEVVRSGRFSVVLARYIQMGQYLTDPTVRARVATVIDLDDLEFVKSARRIAASKSIPLYGRVRGYVNNLMLKRYHRRLKETTLNLVCSREDQDLLYRELGLTNVSVVPNAIELTQYEGISGYNRTVHESKRILFCGNMDYAANREGLEWFVSYVWPMVVSMDPEVSLQVVGLSRHEEQVYRITEKSSVNIQTALNVPDVRPYYADCALTVVPIRIAGGTRIKILEAMACCRPIVSTRVGAEGLDVTDGTELLVRDDPKEMAVACVNLLKDFQLAQALTERGRSFVSRKYDGEVIDREVEVLFDALAPG